MRKYKDGQIERFDFSLFINSNNNYNFYFEMIESMIVKIFCTFNQLINNFNKYIIKILCKELIIDKKLIKKF